MDVSVNNVKSHWSCKECGTEAEWTFADVADAGSPVCGECGDDMELCDEVSIEQPDTDPCPRCGSKSLEYADQEVCNGETYEYYECSNCGLGHTETYIHVKNEWEKETE